ncbi:MULTISPECIES: hypothetical protein [Empedobacter]|mgnify:FL=1|uniref:Uncharacterized protein n=1 Tax=Empedobacter falsenii TaxID=343874 RepID=A0A376G9Z6_9FLAO|nr:MULTISPECIES: hypothetical protein [Empedobacter]MDH1603050.1 hypothetical protein [Empedobacter sp. GD03739]MDM1042090.1 hypothetical protein [Empedobacter brevis]MDM1136035.1 hypothetical protein [Empedobacter sp. R750]STD55617.1 Uncharacterised protein [Empedobacter falsenii]
MNEKVESILNKLLLNASLYSIEYSGILSFKFSISNKSIYYDKIDEVIIEFVSGCKIFNKITNFNIDNNELFELVSLDISNVKLFDDKFLEINIDDRYIIRALEDNFVLNDVKWIIKNKLNNYKIFYDGYKIETIDLIK